MAIKFNGVHKVPGRPTLVGGAEGRKYVANKILNNIGDTNSRPYNSYQQSEFKSESYMMIAREQEGEYGVDEAGLTNESLTEQMPEEMLDETLEEPALEPVAESQPLVEKKSSLGEGFSIANVRRAAQEQEANELNNNHQEQEVYEDYYDEEETAEEELVDEDFAPVEIELNEQEIWSNASTKKTGILRLPTSGVVRSCRGTVELLVHANGRTFKPHYNKCGMLLAVMMSDGYQLVKSQRNHKKWFLKDFNGNVVEPEIITTVAFDKKGNLWYQTESNKRVTFNVDGTTATRN